MAERMRKINDVNCNQFRLDDFRSICVPASRRRA
jgi:hypothetical protein